MADRIPLTNSSLAAFRACPEKYRLRYEYKLSRVETAAALRFGHAYHVGLEAYNDDYSVECRERLALSAVWDYYMVHDSNNLELDVMLAEIAITKALVMGHIKQYTYDDIKFIAVELPFTIPLVNPATGRVSRTFYLAGKMDGIVDIPGVGLAVNEYKTTSTDIESDAYWLALRIDPQISLYYLAARVLGYDVSTILYDVCRKPTIKPIQIPHLDDDKLKQVFHDGTGLRALNKDNTPRQTAGKGLTLRSRIESTDEYTDRLSADILERPGYYYQRREIPRLDGDIERFEMELWQIAAQLRRTQQFGLWYRSPGPFTCKFCEFQDLCLQQITVGPDDVPSGFRRREFMHEELSI